MSCDIGHRPGWDLVFLGLWYRLEAPPPTGPQVWELPYAAGVALKRQKKRTKLVVTSEEKEGGGAQ